MAISFLKWLLSKNNKTSSTEISCRELVEAAQEYQVRELCFWICVDMVANAIGRCEFRTFRGNEEIFEKDYYIWNYEPNTNQNSTMFLHKLIAKLYQDNEALIVNSIPNNGRDTLVVADSWQRPQEYPSRQNEYKGVIVGEYQYQYPIWENNVIHLKLNHVDIRPVINGLYQSYWRLVAAAIKVLNGEKGNIGKFMSRKLHKGERDGQKTFKK